MYVYIHIYTYIYIMLCWAHSLSHVQVFCNPMDYSLPGSSVHGIFQARILEQVAISYSRGSSWPRDWTHVSCISCTGMWILYHSASYSPYLFIFILIYSPGNWGAMRILNCICLTPKPPLSTLYENVKRYKHYIYRKLNNHCFVRTF